MGLRARGRGAFDPAPDTTGSSTPASTSTPSRSGSPASTGCPGPAAGSPSPRPSPLAPRRRRCRRPRAPRSSASPGCSGSPPASATTRRPRPRVVAVPALRTRGTGVAGGPLPGGPRRVRLRERDRPFSVRPRCRRGTAAAGARRRPLAGARPAAALARGRRRRQGLLREPGGAARRRARTWLAFSVGGHRAARDCAGGRGSPLVVARRALDPALGELNRSGALNGHVPVTAIVSLVAVAQALVTGADEVVFTTSGRRTSAASCATGCP